MLGRRGSARRAYPSSEPPRGEPGGAVARSARKGAYRRAWVAIGAVTTCRNWGLAMRFRMRGERLDGRWRTALAARRLADGSTDVVSPDTGVAVPEDGRSGVARRSRTKGTPRAWSCSPGRAMSRLLCRLAGVPLAAGLAVLCTAPAHAADTADGDLRLRGGPSHNDGRLEIFHDNEWGTVCDDFFGRIDAKVACRQMGYTGAGGLATGPRSPSSKPSNLEALRPESGKRSIRVPSSVVPGLGRAAGSGRLRWTRPAPGVEAPAAERR